MTNSRWEVVGCGNVERLLYSTLVVKVNQNNKKQERVLLLTTKTVYNIVPEEKNALIGFFSNDLVYRLGKIIPSQKVKRKIPIITIYGVTYSNIGSEFVIHVPTEYDYRFQSTDE